MARRNGKSPWGNPFIVAIGHYGLIAMNTGSHGLAKLHWPKFRQNNANTGNTQAFGPSGVAGRAAGANAYELCPNYSNPFNPSTTIKYALPRASQVSLSIYDILGHEVSVLVNERKDAGVYEVIFDASRFSSRVFFYRLSVGNFVETKKLLLLR